MIEIRKLQPLVQLQFSLNGLSRQEGLSAPPVARHDAGRDSATRPAAFSAERAQDPIIPRIKKTGKVSGRAFTKPFLTGREPQSDWKPKNGIPAPNPPKNLSGYYFDTYDESVEGTLSAGWNTPEADDTLPRDDGSMIASKIKILDALRDMSGFQDARNSQIKDWWLDVNLPEGQSNSATLTNSFYPEHVLEAVAWKITKKCQQLHIHGSGISDCLDPLILEQSFDSSSLTYGERIDMLAQVYTKYKARAQDAIRGLIEYHLLVPHQLMRSSEYNGKANADRRDYYKAGKDEYEKSGEKLRHIPLAMRVY
ncbi:hypothetical protein NX059_010590 [Plenodomus lindquistii]|nr:hypothetical protein NX059_010590 [Plenodomus lindquistii]